MKASIVFATGLMLAAATVAGSITTAHAGEGGAAGSISAQFSGLITNGLTATAGSVAVGKAAAFTTARTTATDISAVAVGTGGTLAVTGLNAAVVSYTVGGETAAGLAVGQVNTFNAAPSLQITPAGPTPTGVTLP